ncbi:MAG TPA: M20 family metallopeptidase [Terriglobia bacterium]|nr:M20 family metallopeptidase [Terriglobia bacterium]
MLACLQQAVEIESPSRSKPALDRIGAFFAWEFERAGGRAQLHRRMDSGNAVTAEFWSSRHAHKPILILGHTDTVWEVGALSTMPFRIRNGRAYGPGVLDMKSGIVCGLWALKALRELKIEPRHPVRFFLNPDEEVGSRAFRSQIEGEAKQASVCLVLEPAAEGGALKTARKGVGEFRVVVHGRSAHAGIEPQAGTNAICELARQLLRIEGFARPRSGLTINTGFIEGGARPNVVPEYASATIDVRIPRLRDGVAIERKMRSLKPFAPGAHLTVTGGINRPPMERRVSRSLFRKAQELGGQLGMRLDEASTGGGSDGNFTAALGVPTLDGLGGVGGGAHARNEHIIIRELPRRAALLAALIANL